MANETVITVGINCSSQLPIASRARADRNYTRVFFCWGSALATIAKAAYTLSPLDKMAKLTVDGVGEFEVPQGKRLVLALEDEAGVDQLHACGGNARCTTCRVEFLAGEPNQMTIAEKQVLAARGLSGVRLSCQILCDHDMSVRIISRLAGSGRKDVGSRPADDIQPQPVQLVPK